MTVLSITVEQSCEQIISGIPKMVSITTNKSSTIFYTLDGSVPTMYSSIYTAPIYLPFNQLSVILNVLAVGNAATATITECYTTDIVNGNVRLPHSATTAEAGNIIPDSYPFGTPPFQPNQGFLNPAKSGTTVYNPKLPTVSDGYDADGNPSLFSNEPYNSENYQIQYSDSDAEGRQGPNIGNLPAQTTVLQPRSIPEESNQFTTMFDPRATTIYQDFRKADPSDPTVINSQFFSLEDPNVVRYGTFFSNSGMDTTAPPSGSWVRSNYNPLDNTITNYYFDSWAHRWQISKAIYNATGSYDGNLSQIRPGRSPHVYEWIPWARRYLF